MKKILILLTGAILLLFQMSAFAVINSEYEAKKRAAKLTELANYDLLGFVNKAEIVGEKQVNFKMTVMQYKSMAQMSYETINNLLAQIQIVNSSADYNDSEKQAEIQRIYMQIDTQLYNFDSQTYTYLMNLRRVLPSVTYQKYVNKFEKYYNSLGLVEKDMNINVLPN